MKNMAKFILGLISILSTEVHLEANDITYGTQKIKDFDKYYINYNNAQCEKMSNEDKNKLFEDISKNNAVIEQVLENKAGFFTKLLIVKKDDNSFPKIASVSGANGEIKIFLFTSYGECMFGKDVMTRKATMEDVEKYINLEDPKK